jgi:hypothetical protein
MKIMVLGKYALALALPFMIGSAFASGSDSFGGGLSGEQARYNTGKAVYSQRLACPDCMLSGKILDKTQAQKILNDTELTTKLSDDERAALATYLKLRFKL